MRVRSLIMGTGNLADLRKRFSAAEQEEELTWDMDDDKHIKS